MDSKKKEDTKKALAAWTIISDEVGGYSNMSPEDIDTCRTLFVCGFISGINNKCLLEKVGNAVIGTPAELHLLGFESTKKDFVFSLSKQNIHLTLAGNTLHIGGYEQVSLPHISIVDLKDLDHLRRLLVELGL